MFLPGSERGNVQNISTGKIVREVKVASEPEALLAVLKNPAYHFKRIGLEAGPLSNGCLRAVHHTRSTVIAPQSLLLVVGSRHQFTLYPCKPGPRPIRAHAGW